MTPSRSLPSRNPKTTNLYIRGTYLGVPLIRAAGLTGDRSLVPSSSGTRTRSNGENIPPREAEPVSTNPRS